MTPFWHGIASIFLYLFSCSIILLIANNSYKKSVRIGEQKRKITFLFVFIISLFFGYYNSFNSIPGLYGGDRLNYLQDFFGRLTAYPGFDWYLRMMRKLTNGSFQSMLNFTTFICCFFMLIAYKYCPISTIDTLVYILTTNFVFFTFVGLKQGTAGIFANLFFLILFSGKKSRIMDALCWLMIILACSFHVTGYILIPIYFMMRLEYKGKKSLRLLMVLIAAIVLMRPLLLSLASIIYPILPRVTLKIYEYLAEGNTQDLDGTLAVIKGLPYYILALFAIRNRNYYITKIPDYDKLLILTVLAALLAFSTIISYWFSRLSNLFVFPLGLLFGQLVLHAEFEAKKHNLIILVLFPELFLTLRSIILVFLNYGGY